MTRTTLRPLLPLLPLLLTACATAPVPRPQPTTDPVLALAAADFPGAPSLLHGVDALDDDAAMRPGDAALFALEFTRGTTIERQLLLLEVHALPVATVQVGAQQHVAAKGHDIKLTTTSSDGTTSVRDYRLRDVDVRFRRFTADGQPLADATATLFVEALRAGWWPDTAPGAARRDNDLATVLTLSLQSLANSEPTLQELLFLVVDRPSLLSIAGHLGVKVVVRSTVDQAQSFLPPLAAASGQPVRVHSIDLDVNGAQALFADLLVVEPRAATMLCGGLVGAVARHPTAPDRRVVARLLATRRAPVAPS